MNRTNIPFADLTWNPVSGCSNSCPYCYARGIARRFGNQAHAPLGETAHEAKPKMMPFPYGFEPTIYPHRIDEPLRRKKPATIFVASMADIFDDSFPDSFRDKVLNVIELGQQHTFLILTKQAAEMRRYFTEVQPWIPRDGMTRSRSMPLNLWLGVTATNQADADERIPLLLDTPAEHRFVCLEPLQGPVDFDGLWGYPGSADSDHLAHWPIDLVIVGGETPGQPLHERGTAWWSEDELDWLSRPDALRNIRDQCEAAGIPLHYKHGSTNPPLDGTVYDWRP